MDIGSTAAAAASALEDLPDIARVLSVGRAWISAAGDSRQLALAHVWQPRRAGRFSVGETGRSVALLRGDGPFGSYDRLLPDLQTWTKDGTRMDGT